MTLRALFLVILIFLTGCTGERVETLPKSHPASPEGEEAPMGESSHTLDIPRVASATRAATKETTPPQSEAAQLYACPMHPEVTSTNPEDRCPKCKMKINKPVAASTGGSSHGGHP